MKEENVKNPYIDGRREWNERYGSYIAQARNWRIVAMLSIFLTLFSVGGVIYMASQSQVQPYIVEVDKLGDAMTVAPAQAIRSYDVKVIKFMLGEFVNNLRTVYKEDSKIQKQMIYKVYNYLSTTLPAYQQINQFYQQNSPFEKTFNTQVEITSVLVLAEKTFQVDWVERQLDKTGKYITNDGYRATVNVEIVPPSTAAEMMKNPLGLYVKDISLQQTLTKE